MQSFAEYSAKTESAVRLLFDGIASYDRLIPDFKSAIFVSSEIDDSGFEVAYSAWRRKNANALAAATEAERKYLAESFALDTLCGAVFQVAGKAIEVYSDSTHMPSEWTNAIGPNTAKYCRGRLVRTVPLGLVVYAARNKHAHYNDGSLRPLSSAVFERLATEHEYPKSEVRRDPAFDLTNTKIDTCAHNVMPLIGWTTYENYAADLATLVDR